MQCRSDPPADAREEDGVKPDVGIAVVERKPRENIDADSACVRYRLAHRRLKAVAQVEDDAGLLDPRDFARRQFQVVRLRPRRSQVVDVELGPPICSAA